MRRLCIALASLLLLSGTVLAEKHGDLSREATIAYIQERLSGAFSCEQPDRTLLFSESSGYFSIYSKKANGQRYRAYQLVPKNLDPDRIDVQDRTGSVSVTLYTGANSEGLIQYSENGFQQSVTQGTIACFRDRTNATSFGNAMAHLMELDGAASDPF